MICDMGDESKPPPHLTQAQFAAAVFHDLKETQRATFSVFADYGKWLISSLVLIHSGALFGLFSFLDTIAQNPAALQNYKLPIWSFVVGLFLGLTSGFFAWVNWGMHSANAADQADMEMLWNPDKWVGEKRFERGLDVTNVLAIAAGIASGVCILVGAAMILHGDYLKALVSGG